MKNYLTLVLALTVVSAPAFASRARLEALGEGKNGSYYIDDSRDIFLNPAEIVHYKKKLWLELGTEPTETVNGSVSSVQDSPSAPRGQGGFSNTFGDFTYGVYMNQTSERALNAIHQVNALIGATSASANTLIAPDSQLEAFFAGEGSLDWGVSLLYAGNNSQGYKTTSASSYYNKTASLFAARAGVEAGNLQAFTTVGIASDTKTGDAVGTELKGKISIDLAATYKMDNWTSFAKWASYGDDFTAQTGATATEIRFSSYGIGAGYKKDVTKSTNIFTRVEADMQKITSTGSATNSIWNVPVVVGAEAQALSWLTIRGSVSESVLGQQTDGANRNNLGQTTTVSTGLGLTFGDVQIDGLVSASTAATTDTYSNLTLPGFGTGPQTTGKTGFGDNLLSRVAITYNF